MFYIHKAVIIYSYCFVTWFFNEYPSIPFLLTWKVKVFVIQLCLTLWGPMDCSLPGSSVLGIFQTRILKCVAIPFSRGSSWPGNRTWVFCIAGRLFITWATREAMQETQVWSLGWEDPLEKGMAAHSSILAWRIPRTEEPEGYSLQGCKELDMTDWLTHTHKHRNLLVYRFFIIINTIPLNILNFMFINSWKGNYLHKKRSEGGTCHSCPSTVIGFLISSSVVPGSLSVASPQLPSSPNSFN